MSFPRNKDLTEESNIWIKKNKRYINIFNQQLKSEPEKEHQSIYTSLNLCYKTIGLAKFFRGDPIDEVKATFIKSAECIEMSFVMAYDENSKYYLGDKADDVRVSMTYAIKGMHAALAGSDFDTARRVAKWTRLRKVDLPKSVDPKNDSILTTNYSHALKHLLLGNIEEARKCCESSWMYFQNHKANIPYRINFGNRCELIRSILKNKPKEFDRLIEIQTAFHKKSGRLNGELEDTPEAEIFVEGVALTNLALKHKLKLKFVDEKYIPQELLLTETV